MKDSDEIYSLNIEDLQTVADQVCERKLTVDEIKQIVPIIEDRMPWFEVIETAIQEVIDSHT